MPATRTAYRCSSCGADTPKWVGQCPTCHEWNTLVEETVLPRAATASQLRPSSPPPVPITEVAALDAHAAPSGIDELDRVLGGGLVPGSVTLAGGEPGIGKSTLLLQMAACYALAGTTVLYASAEESIQQIRLRAERLGALPDGLWLVSETSLPHLLDHIDRVQPQVLVVDSVQTIYDPDLSGSPGSVGQVRECAARLVTEAKRRTCTTVLVGHVTKDGSLAGPRVLEHLVDTVLAFEGDHHHALRLLRAVKHRFGSTNELGLFEMTDRGLLAVPDPSHLFLADRKPGTPGSVVVPTVEGNRPLLVEVQALVAPSNIPSPRRSANGVDPGRLALLLAVLDRRAGLSVAGSEVYGLAVGGVRLVEPAVDLALALAIASSFTGRAVPSDLVVCGEVGLGGEVRQVGQCERRMAEAARLGFQRAMVPRLAPQTDDLRTVRVGSLIEAIAAAGLLDDDPPWPLPSSPNHD